MAQFDVYRLPHDGGWVVDCQSDLHDHLESRFVVPLIPVARAPAPASRLHPTLTVNGDEFVLATHLATAVRLRELRQPLTSLADQRLAIVGAIDVLVTGI